MSIIIFFSEVLNESSFLRIVLRSGPRRIDPNRTCVFVSRKWKRFTLYTIIYIMNIPSDIEPTTKTFDTRHTLRSDRYTYNILYILYLPAIIIYEPR